MKYAWVENGRIRDIAHSNPNEIYHPDVAVHYDALVPDEAANGDGWVNGQLTKPEPLPTPPAPPRTWTVDSIRSGLTLSERVKWDNDSAPEIITAKQEMVVPQELAHTTEVLALLVNASLISTESVAKILS
jgi:hypothetical protein